MLVDMLSDEANQALIAELSAYVENMHDELDGITFSKEHYKKQGVGVLVGLLKPKSQTLVGLRYLNTMLERIEEDDYQENIDANQERVQGLIDDVEDDVQDMLDVIYLKTMTEKGMGDVRDAWMRDRFGFNS
jgi:hypothetical protein